MTKYWLFAIFLLLSGCTSKIPYSSYPQSDKRIGIHVHKASQPIPYVKPNSSAYLIVIDPGHGGDDEGTISPTKPIYREKSLTLTTSRWLRTYLNQMGYQTQMTRDEDVFIPLHLRSAKANEVEPVLFVSVHYNSAPSVDAHGIEVFYYLSDTDPTRTKASKELAAIVLDEVLQNTQAKSRGVKTANFSVIRETKMPAILIEGGFLTNQDELQKIKDPAYQKKLAWGVARGIDHYLKRRRNS